ncbi:MAG: bifunctional UDP-sugar hydrolase/5'-nucleotidase [Hungatella sp.]
MEKSKKIPVKLQVKWSSCLVLLVGLMMSCLSGCGKKIDAQAVEEKDIAILYTNDVHCAVEDHIGYAGLAAYEKELTEQGCEVLLVDVGDAIQGAPIGSLSKGENIIDIMNELGYDVAIPGNHEFDYGVEQLKALAKRAEFPYLSANFIEADSKKHIFAPYVMKEVSGVKIGFVGVSTPLTLTSSNPTHFKDEKGTYLYDFMADADGTQLYSEVQKAVEQVREEGADYVVALTHLGIGAVYSPYLATELITHTHGIDAVLDGHSHTTAACERVKNQEGKWTLLSQAGSKLESVGMLLIDKTGNLSTGLLSEYDKKDAETETFIKNIESQYEALLNQKVAVTQNTLTVHDPVTGERIIRNAETNLGNLCADAYLAAGKADVALVNGGGIRADLPEGDITYGDILGVFPYGNGLCVIEATGQELLDALEHGTRQMPEENGGFLQVAGLTYEVDPEIPSAVKTDDNQMFLSVDGPRRVQHVKIAGTPIDPDQTYTVVSHSFLIKNGGDGYTMFADNNLLQDEFVEDYTALIDYLMEDYTQKSDSYKDPYGEGRIVAVEKQ